MEVYKHLSRDEGPGQTFAVTGAGSSGFAPGLYRTVIVVSIPA